MSKILILLLLIPWQLSAWDKESTTKIYHHVFHALTNKKEIKIYTKDKEYANAFYASKDMNVVQKIANADVILVTNKDEIAQLSRQSLPKTTLLFTTSYKLLKAHSEIIGAFYWRKGRSQLLFVKKRLQEKHITLPKEFQKYIIEAL